MKIVYSFNKRGFEAELWAREIAGASTESVQFIPFNHDPYVEVTRYIRAQLLDNLYFDRNSGLMRLYADFERAIARCNADAIVVDNCPPYHPEFLRTLSVYKALRVNDGPLAAYDRDFAYLHAYDHVLYHSAAYSRDLSMPQKLDYCRARRHDFWPLAVFDAAFDQALSEAELFAGKRDIDVIFIGSFSRSKMPVLARIKKHFGSRCVMHGLINFPKNVYFNINYGFPGWMNAVPMQQFPAMYRRSKVGFNVHNRGKYTVGNYRLFDLPANGVMQVSDGGEFLSQFFQPGHEVVLADEADSIIEKVEHYLVHETERVEIARAGYRAVMARHRFKPRMQEMAALIWDGMQSGRPECSAPPQLTLD